MIISHNKNIFKTLFMLFAIVFVFSFENNVEADDSASRIDGPDEVAQTDTVPTTYYALFGGTPPGNYTHSCYFYVSDGAGTYHLMGVGGYNNNFGPNSYCKFSWNTSGTSIYTTSGVTADRRTIFAILTSERPPETLTENSPVENVRYDGYARKTVTLLKTVTPRIEIVINHNHINQGDILHIIGVINDPNDFSGKQCYFYVGDGAGKWYLQGKGEVFGCNAYWYSENNTAVADHGVRVNIQEAGLQNGDPDAKGVPVASTTVKVCAKGSTTCEPSSPETPASGTASSSSSSSSTITTSGGGLFASIAAPDLTTVEGIYNFIVSLTEALIGILGFITVIVGGFFFLTAGGDSAAAEKGKKSIIYGIVGIVVAVLSISLVTIIINMLKSSGMVK